AVTMGKIALLNGMYLVRQGHSGSHYKPPPVDWVLDADWSESYHRYRDTLADCICENEPLSKSEAGQCVDSAFARYLVTQIEMKHIRRPSRWGSSRRAVSSALRTYAPRAFGAAQWARSSLGGRYRDRLDSRA